MAKTGIGKIIEVAMVRKNFTQKNLADKLGVKQQMVSQWINGQSNPKTSTLAKIAAALDVSVDYFVENTDAKCEKGSVSKIDLLEEKIKRHELEISVLKKENDLLKKDGEFLKKEIEQLRENMVNYERKL